MVEPITTSLLIAAVSALARAGTGMMVQRLTEPRAVSAITPMDLSAGTAITSRASVRFRSIAAGTPYWVWFGVQRSDGWRVEIPVLYKEPVSVVLRRGEYEMLALFLAKPASFADKPLLMAVGRHHDVIASASEQLLSITGSPPNDQQIAILKSPQFPELPFRLPHTTTELPNLLARSRYGSTLLPTSTQLPAVRSFLQSGQELRSIRPALEPPKSLITPNQRPVVNPGPEPSITPTTLPTTAVCKAQLRAGVRCTNPAQGSDSNICQMHLDMLVAGKEIRWHATGQRIRLACHARLASGARCDGGIVRDQLCKDHLASVAGGRAVFWHASGKRVRLACGARTRSGARCRNDPVQKGLCRVHIDMAQVGEWLVWHETGARIRIGRY